MVLTAEIFEEVRRALRSDPRPGRDKRLEPRVGMRSQVQIVPCLLDDSGLSATPITVRNLSRSGIGLLHRHEMRPGAEFVALLPRRNGMALGVLCKVIFCRQAATDLFSIGGRMLRMLSPHDARLSGLPAA